MKRMKGWIVPKIIISIVMVVAIATLMVACSCTGSKPTPSPDTIAPMVSYTVPANTATGVHINSAMAITFSEEMNPSTVTTSTFTLKQGTTTVSGVVTYIGVTATFTPSANLAAGTTYTAMITTGAKDLAGNTMTSNYAWSFTTAASSGGGGGGGGVILIDDIAPMVSYTVPANTATGVHINSAMAITFSEAMNPSTVTTSTFTLKQGSTTVSGAVTYVGFTATFDPASDLAAGTTYTAMITTGAKDLAGNPLTSNYAWNFTTASGDGTLTDDIAPMVTYSIPDNTDIDVLVNSDMAAIFSEAMNPLTITTVTFTLKQGETPVSGAVSYVGFTATFDPDSDLAAGTTYTAMITTGAKDLAGNPLTSNYAWSFTTAGSSGGGGGGGGGGVVVVDTTRPTVISTVPINSASGAGITSDITATFSEAMRVSTITTVTFTLTQEGTPVLGAVSCIGSVATFNPTDALSISTEYVATITTGVTDLAGNALEENYSWSFTTGAAPDTTPPTVISTIPIDASTGVAINIDVRATFSEAMTVLTINTSTFTLKQGTTPVSGTVLGTGSTATFNPTANLAIGTTYTATITTGVQDLALNNMAANYSWSFTTGDGAFVIGPAQAPVPLGSASTFAILSKAGITAYPTNTIIGNVGSYDLGGSSVDPLTCPEVPAATGTIYVTSAGGPTLACQVISTTILNDAATDALAAYTNAVNAARGTPQSISGNLNGLTLYPGLYESGTSIEISAAGDLYLDAQGDSNAVFVIRSATTITTEATSEVHLTGGAKATNVYWSAGSAVTLGTNSIMKGTFIASTALTMLSGANLEGRLLTQGAAATAISVEASTITLPTP